MKQVQTIMLITVALVVLIIALFAGWKQDGLDKRYWELKEQCHGEVKIIEHVSPYASSVDFKCVATQSGELK